MTKTSNIFLILLTCISLFACQEDDFGSGAAPDMATLIAQGKYLAARNAETYAAQVDPEKGTWFPDGTPFRLLAFTKPYVTDPETGEPADPDYNPKYPTAYNYATTIRFNEVTWEGEIKTSFGDIVRYININGDPDKMFGFSALSSADGSLSEEQGGAQKLVALDFYGFTYGEKVDKISNDYIKLDNLDYTLLTQLDESSNENPTNTSILECLKKTEKVYDDGKSLNDLMRGQLLNCDIQPEKGEAEDIATQSIIPFKHCFSRLEFMVVQEAVDNDPDKASFENLYVEEVKVTGTYDSCYVYLKDGKVKLLGDPKARPLQFNSEYKGPVTTKQVYLGDMIIFPSDGNSLKNTNLADGYSLGLEITVKSTDPNALNNFIINTGNKLEDYPITQIKEKDKDDKPYYTCTVKKAEILNSNSYDENGNANPLYLKQNTTYTLVIAFQKDAVRIITVVPVVEEWLPGEVHNNEPWQDQPIGQPQMFDNIVWSDRNLGADGYDAKSNFEYTIGYYYQPHRNIPYFPFNKTDYYVGSEIPIVPTPENKRDKKLSLTGSYNNSTHKVYPMVDAKILNMLHPTTGLAGNGVKGGDKTWTVLTSDCYTYDENKKKIDIYYKVRPQMEIPDTKPTNTYFDFYEEIKWDDDNVHWEQGAQNQPANGSWSIPSAKDFMTIFPSTPHAGNFTFRGGGNNADPMNGWGRIDIPPIEENVKTLRVTVPFYATDMTEPGLMETENGPVQYRHVHDVNYNNAWYTLKNNNNDPGTTHMDKYPNDCSPGWHNIIVEPNGDPDDGYASVYVISREEINVGEYPNVGKLSDDVKDDNKYKISSWGTIYGIKRVYTDRAYRMRWRVVCVEQSVTKDGVTKKIPAFYVEVCRYRCKASDVLTEENYKDKTKFDWDHPAATIYFPMCGIVEKGTYYNFGTECLYATSDAIIKGSAKASALQLKVTGDDPSNAYISVIRDVVSRNFGMQIRPIVGGVNSTK